MQTNSTCSRFRSRSVVVIRRIWEIYILPPLNLLTFYKIFKLHQLCANCVDNVVSKVYIYLLLFIFSSFAPAIQTRAGSTANYPIEVRIQIGIPYLDQGTYPENSTKGVWSFFLPMLVVQSGIFARKYVKKYSLSDRKKLVFLSLIALLHNIYLLWQLKNWLKIWRSPMVHFFKT